MKVATLAFVAAYFAVHAEAGLPGAGSMERLKVAARKFEARRLASMGDTEDSLTNRDEDSDSLGNRWAFGGSTPSYSYGGNTYNRGGYIANPSPSAIERANNAGALTRSEYKRLTNRDEDDDLGGFVNCDYSRDCSGDRRRLAVGKKTASKAKKASKESVGTQNKKSDDAKKSAKKETAVEKDTKSA